LKSRLNVKQRPQPTRMACRRVDFSRPWRVETRPTQGTHVSCFGVSLLNMVVSAASRLFVAWLLSATFSAQAFTLAELRGSVVIGRPLDVTVQIQAAAGEEVSGDCLSAEVLYADIRQTNVRVSVMPSSAMTAAPVLRVQVGAFINEPVVTVVVRATCGSSTLRRYVMLPDFPDTTKLALPNLPVGEAAPVLVLQPATKPARVSKSVSARATKADSTQALSPLKSPAAMNASTPKKKRSKTVARAAGKAVLKLDPLDIFSDRMDTLDADMVFAPTEDTLLHSRKIAELEQDVKTLRALAVHNDAKLSDLRQQLQQAQDSQIPLWLVQGIGLLLLACVAALGWLLWQQRRLAQEQELSEWWKNRDLDTPVEFEALDSSRVKPQPPQVKPVQAVQAAEMPVVTKEVPFTVKEDVVSMPVHRVVDMASFEVHTDSAALEGSHIRHINLEPILDIRQQAEFFVSLGQADRALAILNKQIAQGTEPNPLLYLDLIALYHSLGMKAEYRKSADAFNQLFNGIIPDFSRFNAQEQGIEDYPEVLQQLVSLWPRTEALVFLNACIFHDPQIQPRQTFELTAFRDLLLLNAMADTLAPQA